MPNCSQTSLICAVVRLRTRLLDHVPSGTPGSSAAGRFLAPERPRGAACLAASFFARASAARAAAASFAAAARAAAASLSAAARAAAASLSASARSFAFFFSTSAAARRAARELPLCFSSIHVWGEGVEGRVGGEVERMGEGGGRGHSLS